MEKTIALLVAAGSSTRMQGERPKPYLPLGDKTMLRHTVETFLSHPQIDGVRVVIRRQDHPLFLKAVQGLTLFPCVIGGSTRQQSVHRGLESIAHRQPQNVLVHDIARPFASHALISRVIDALEKHPAAIPALPVIDTVKRAHSGLVSETVSRKGLYTVQTPQGFHYLPLLAAHRRFASESFTDDAMLCEQSGIPVALVEGEPENRKITTPNDLMYMNQTETKVGMGFDVHALKPYAPDTPQEKRIIMLCGIAVPSGHFAEGHSDADVGLHAAVDALLGAISAGDIGQHFPPTDPRWKGADSSQFLLHAQELVKARGGRIAHLDITLICERPKIGPYREQMAAHVAALLGLSAERISIKATTTEKLGFTGRGEGIAAQTVATVVIPAL